MKRLIPVIALLVAFCAFAGAQDIKAVTEDGRDVLLHNDGTWGYVDKPQASVAPTRTFKAPDTAISKAASRKAKISVFYDPTLWTVEKLTGEAAEFQFQLGDSEVYARLIAEAETFDLATVRSGIIANAKKAAKSFDVTEEGVAIVNGVQVQTLKAKVKMQGIDVTFYWYYWSGPKGTVQLYGYASPADFDANFKAILDLMNGLTL
jgi:hypothetical protein